MQKVGKIDYTFNMMIYGKWGIGKTFFTGQADSIPEMRKVLFVDVEGGTLSLRQDFPNIDLVRVTNWNEMQAVYDALHAGGHSYRTVVIDSLTEAQKFNLDQIMLALIEKGVTNSQGELRDRDIPGLQEWGKNSSQIRRFVRAFRDLPINTIFTALDKEDKDNMLRPITTVDLPGKLAGQVPAFLDYVFRYYQREIPSGKKNSEGQDILRTARVMQTQATEKALAKARVGSKPRLPKFLVDPTMKQVWDFLQLEDKNIKEEAKKND